jgi:hypothetical protein
VTEPELIEEILAHNIDALFDDLNAPDYHDEIVNGFDLPIELRGRPAMVSTIAA